MFQPAEVQRDKYGFWLHPAFDTLEEEQPIHEHPDAEGMEFRYVEFFDDAPADLREMYEEGSSLWSAVTWEDAVKAWTPQTPESEGWFLVAVYDTEDGPYACFARPKVV